METRETTAANRTEDPAQDPVQPAARNEPRRIREATPEINFLGRKRKAPEAPQRMKKILRPLFIIGCIILVGYGIHSFLPTNASNNPLAYNPITLEPKKPESFLKRLTIAVFTKEKKLAGQDDDRINVLLLGMGGAGHDGPYLTDTIMIASLKPSTHQIALVSIPRDLSVDIPGHGTDKINAADSIGETKKPGWGGAATAEVIEHIFHLPIHYYARVDFKAFEEIIDDVGGVTVNVDRTFVDQMYPAGNDEYETISFTKGTQTMDGKTALTYARSRHGSNGEGSDFARAKRQQKMLAALKQKLLSFDTYANPVRIHDMLNSLDKHVTTNMEFSDMIALVKIIRSWGTDSTKTLVLNNGPEGFLQDAYTQKGAYILEPREGNFNAITDALRTIFNDETKAQEQPAAPNQTETQRSPARSPRIEIQNGTWAAGLAARMKKRLEDMRFVIAKIGNTGIRPQASSGIYRMHNGTFDETVRNLEEELHIPVKQAPPNDVTAASDTDILILLGEDTQE